MSNAMQDIGGVIEHLTVEAEADKDIFTRLTESVESLT